MSEACTVTLEIVYGSMFHLYDDKVEFGSLGHEMTGTYYDAASHGKPMQVWHKPKCEKPNVQISAISPRGLLWFTA